MITRALHIYKNSCPYDCVDFKALMPGTNEREVGTASLLPLPILKSVPLTEKLEDPCSAGEVLFPSSPVSAVWQCDTAFDSISDVSLQTAFRHHHPASCLLRTQASWSHTPRGPSLGPGGISVHRSPGPCTRNPSTACNRSETHSCGLRSQTHLRSLPRPPSKASLWGQQTFPTLLTLVWDRQSGLPNQISDEQGSSRSQGTGTNFGYAVVSSFPSSSSFSFEDYYFWLNHLRVICRHWWLKRLQIYFLRARQSSKWPQSSNHIEDTWALI